jgi:hypothetical protein
MIHSPKEHSPQPRAFFLGFFGIKCKKHLLPRAQKRKRKGNRKMQNANVVELRTSDLILDRKFNPTRSVDYDLATPRQLMEACGIIPDFFAAACLQFENRRAESEADNVILSGLTEIALSMNEAYGFGGFDLGEPRAHLDSEGRYFYPNDPALSPLARFTYGLFELFVYEYGITALREMNNSQSTITGRFD